jgi:hypothetical protein
MAQREILDFMRQRKRPITSKDLNFLNISFNSRTRALSQLSKFGFICSAPKQPRKPIKYWLK